MFKVKNPTLLQKKMSVFYPSYPSKWVLLFRIQDNMRKRVGHWQNPRCSRGNSSSRVGNNILRVETLQVSAIRVQEPLSYIQRTERARMQVGQQKIRSK